MSSGFVSKRDFHVAVKMGWHGGTIVKSPEMADLPEIGRAPLRYVLPSGEIREWYKQTVPISLDDGLPVGVQSSESYAIFSPRDAWTYLAECLTGTEYKVTSTGMIFDRSRWFLTAELTELTAISRPGHNFYANLSGGLDKSQSPLLCLGDTEQVCANTVAIARKESRVFSGRLTRNFATRLEESKARTESLIGFAKVWNLTMEKCAKVAVSVDTARHVFAGEMVGRGANFEAKTDRAKNQLDTLVDMFNGQTRGDAGRNKEQVLRAFTEYYGQGPVGMDSTRDAFSRWESSEFGGFADRKADFAESMTTADGWNAYAKAGRAALAKAAKSIVAV